MAKGNFKCYKYTVFNKTRSKKLFTLNQIEKIKDRIDRVNKVFELEYGKFNAKRLSSYPHGIMGAGVCALCEMAKEVIHFDDDISMCEECANDNNLL